MVWVRSSTCFTNFVKNNFQNKGIMTLVSETFCQSWEQPVTQRERKQNLKVSLLQKRSNSSNSSCSWDPWEIWTCQSLCSMILLCSKVCWRISSHVKPLLKRSITLRLNQESQPLSKKDLNLSTDPNSLWKSFKFLKLQKCVTDSCYSV